MFRTTSTNTFRNVVNAAFKTDLNQIGVSAFKRRWPNYNVADVVSHTQKRGLFYADVGLGPSNPRTSAYFIKNQLSTDDNSGAMRRLFEAPQTDDQQKTKAAYGGTFEKIHGRPPQAGELRGPWFDFEFVDEKKVRDPNEPYVNSFRKVAEAGLSRTVQDGSETRSGQVHFFLNGFDARMYVDSIVMTEITKGIPCDKYVAQISLPDLIEEDREADRECKAGPPTITSIEVYDASMGAFKDTGKKFQWRAANEAPLDFRQFQMLQEKAFSAARKPDNRKILQENGKMTEEAEAAIADLQQYISIGRLPA